MQALHVKAVTFGSFKKPADDKQPVQAVELQVAHPEAQFF
jgi:hypothetical protein